jgi:hypothetical protein
MVQPWFEPDTFGMWYGIVGGGGFGTLMGIGGGIAGSFLIPRGIGRRWVLGSMVIIVLLGLAQTAFGLYALFAGQPYGIWYPPTLAGAISALVVGCLLPAFRKLYAVAEARRMDAQAIRDNF